MAKQLSDYGTGMKDIIMTQLARERQAAHDRYVIASDERDFAGGQVRDYNRRMKAVLLNIYIGKHTTGA